MKERGGDPSLQPMPAKKVKWIGAFDVAKLDAAACKAMSVPGAELKDVGEAVNEINVKKGVNRIVVRLDMVQSRWPESASLVVCPDGLDAPFPVRDMIPDSSGMIVDLLRVDILRRTGVLRHGVRGLDEDFATRGVVVRRSRF